MGHGWRTCDCYCRLHGRFEKVDLVLGAAALGLDCLGGDLARLGFLLHQFCEDAAHLQLLLLRLGLHHGLGVLVGVVRVGVWIGLPADLADTLHQFVALWNVHSFDHKVEDGDNHLRRGCGQLGCEVEQLLCLCLTLGRAPIFFADYEVGLVRGDGGFRVGRIVDLEVFGVAAHVGYAENIFLGVELLDVHQQLLAMDHAGHTEVVEKHACGKLALVLAGDDSLARGGVGLAAKVFVCDARDLLDHLRVTAHQVHVCLCNAEVCLNPRCGKAFFVNNHAIGAACLVAQFLNVVHRAFFDGYTHG